MKCELYQGDCLEIMPTLKEHSVDMVLCDLPYNVTALKWDTVIPFEDLWTNYKRLIIDGGVIVLFSQQPFTTALIHSCCELYRYSWVWDKCAVTGFLNANYAPLKRTEDINVFSNATVGSQSKKPIIFHPQGVIEINRTKKNNPKSTWRKNKGYGGGHNQLNSDTEFVQKYTNYPCNVLKFQRDKNAVHPTQKPVALLEYLIKTYTNEGATVLDNCMGSGTTGVACVHTQRNFIGIEKDMKYFQIAKERIEKEQTESLFVEVRE